MREVRAEGGGVAAIMVNLCCPEVFGWQSSVRVKLAARVVVESN